MHRILVSLNTRDEWYSVVREANAWFGRNWRGQRRVRRQLRDKISNIWQTEPKKVWFEVPDIKFASWITVKYTLPVDIVKGTDPEISQ